MLRPTKVASEDCDLPKTVPSQSEAESGTNQATGQTSSPSADNKQMVERESVAKTKSGRVVRKPARFRDDAT